MSALRRHSSASGYNARMNEREILRGQLATERIHAAQVASACVTLFGTARDGAREPSAAFRDASVSYLAWVLSRFEQRDQLLGELIERHRRSAQRAPEAGVPEELDRLVARTGTSRQALTRLEEALAATASRSRGSSEAWQAFGQYFNAVWCERREAIERQLPRLRQITGWRDACAVDADSILEERARYARVAEHLPPGITLVGAAER